MSRVGKRIIGIPKDTIVKVVDSNVEVFGKLGTLKRTFSSLIAIHVKDQEISTLRANEEKHTKQLHGTTNSHIQSMIIGVSQGYKKEIEIKGVGYKAALRGDKLEVIVGYSQPVLIDIIPKIKIEVPKPTQIIVSGIDKQQVGYIAAIIRNIRKPNPYSGKGIMYKGEQLKLKEGKAVAK